MSNLINNSMETCRTCSVALDADNCPDNHRKYQGRVCVECRRQYQTAHSHRQRAKDPIAFNEKRKAYIDTKREEVNAYNREWRKNNREKNYECVKNWNARNPEKRRSYHQKWAEKRRAENIANTTLF